MTSYTVLRKIAAGLFLPQLVFPQLIARPNKYESTAPRSFPVTAAAVPNLQQCTHRVGRLWFTVTNYGMFGNQAIPAAFPDCITGNPSPSAEFLGGSGIEYLFQGALWVGGIVNGDTLVSIGNDGWAFPGTRELWPGAGPSGEIIKRSTNPASPFFSPDAVSDLDMIATVFDTLTDTSLVDPDPADSRPHKPLGLKIVQTSLSYDDWLLEDLVILHYKLENIGSDSIKDAFVGIFWDGDVGHHLTAANFWVDDLTGFFESYVFVSEQTVSLEIPFLIDNDGINRDVDIGSAFGAKDPTSGCGLSFWGASQPAATSFNWWMPNQTVLRDWGPQLAPGRTNLSGGRGQPQGDAMKYYYMSNGEKDYLQVSAAVNHSTEGWLPPLPAFIAVDIANGYDTRYLYSFGPFQLAPADTASFDAAVLMGDKMHQNHRNWLNNLGLNPNHYLDSARINVFQRGLGFSDLTYKALAAMQKTGFIHAVKGDVDGDSMLTAADAVTLLNSAFLNDPIQTLFFHDVNCDRVVTGVDVVLLLNRIFMDVPLPC